MANTLQVDGLARITGLTQTYRRILNHRNNHPHHAHVLHMCMVGEIRLTAMWSRANSWYKKNLKKNWGKIGTKIENIPKSHTIIQWLTNRPWPQTTTSEKNKTKMKHHCERWWKKGTHIPNNWCFAHPPRSLPISRTGRENALLERKNWTKKVGLVLVKVCEIDPCWHKN